MIAIGSRFMAGALVLGLSLAVAAPASAASPLAAMPVGQSVNYHVTTQSDKPPVAGGATSTDNYVRIARASAATFNVQVDGAPAGQITVNPDGSLDIPPSLKKVLAPFGEAGLLMRGAPQPLAPNGSWAANVPVPLGDATDNVTATVSVAQLGANGATITANGQNATEVKPGLRAHPADVDYSATLHFNAAHMLTGANRTISVSVKKGALRSKNSSNSWTLTLAGQ